MANITAIAKQFFEACEAGKGWDVCRAYCSPNATFSAQAEPLANTHSLREYCDWMKGLLTFMPDGRYELKSFATDEERQNVAAYGVFYATHTARAVHVRQPARAPEPTTSMSWTLTATRSAT